jgi:hypothetical protein
MLIAAGAKGQNGKVLYKKFYGYKDIANHIPLEDRTLFPWHPSIKRLQIAGCA